jgi:[protein-PII] uridylyltransferase
MADLLRSITRLFRWRTEPATSGVSYGAETAVAQRLWPLLEARASSRPGTSEEAVRQALVPALRPFIAAEQHAIETAHRGGAGGLEVVALQADLVDALISQLYRLADCSVRAEVREQAEGCALVALGGYGRRELNPGSDVDLMFLYPRRADAYVTAVLHHVLYALWDLGFTVGHSARSLADAARMLDADLSACTAMLEARFLAGHPAVFAAFQERLWRSFQGRRVQQYVGEKLAERSRRHEKYGGSVYLQEPNVKEGPGGLRDFHVALWVGRARHHLTDLTALASLHLLTPAEVSQCLEALDFLLRVRTDLHYLLRGKHDVLGLQFQAQIAADLGFHDGAVGDVERFMREYYLRAGAVHQLASQITGRCLDRPGSPMEAVMTKLRARDIGDDFVARNRQIHVPPAHDSFAEDPVRLLKIFWYAQEMGYELSVEAKDAVRAHLHLIDDAFRRSNRALGAFLAVLKAPRGVAHTLRLMHQLGVLTAYIPEFGRIACLVQFDYYHRYTVDEHTFVLLDVLEGLRETTDPRLQEFRRIAAELRKPEILKWAILLHDIGKGEGHGHVERSADLAAVILTRMGLPARDIADTVFLVAQHLTMAHIAERRDLDDERMIIEFARQVENEDLLRMLYLLTYLDINAVGPQVWTDWKGTLLWELFIKTHTVLTRGVPEGEEQQRRAQDLRGTILAELEREFGADLVAQHLNLMPVRYVLTTSPAKVAQHLKLIERVRRGELVSLGWTAYPLAGYSEVLVCAPGAPGRFSNVVGTLTANGINILSAQLFSRADGVMIRTFQVSDGRGAALEDEGIWHRFRQDLRAVMLGQSPVRDLIRSRRRDLLAKPAPRPREIQTRVEFDNVVSDRFTVIDIRAQDRLGLLYLIASTLSGLDLDVSLAKIATEVDQAMDVFYVTEKDGGKVSRPERLDEIRQGLVHAIAEGIA